MRRWLVGLAVVWLLALATYCGNAVNDRRLAEPVRCDTRAVYTYMSRWCATPPGPRPPTPVRLPVTAEYCDRMRNC